LTKITLLIFSFFLLILAACSPASTDAGLDQAITGDNPDLQELENTVQVDIQSGDSGSSTSNPDSDIPIVDQFQTIYIDPNNVKVISSEMVEWPDSCLGIDQMGVECIPGATRGYEVHLEAKGLAFDYHSDQVGSQVRPATKGLVWTRENGESTICDRLVIFLPDTANVCWCEGGEIYTASVNLQEILTEDEYKLLIDSLATFSEHSVNRPSPDQSHPAMVSLSFHGQGQTPPTVDQQRSLIRMAELIFDRVIP
jgi:hypothetical protein